MCSFVRNSGIAHCSALQQTELVATVGRPGGGGIKSCRHGIPPLPIQPRFISGYKRALSCIVWYSVFPFAFDDSWSVPILQGKFIAVSFV